MGSRRSFSSFQAGAKKWSELTQKQRQDGRLGLLKGSWELITRLISTKIQCVWVFFGLVSSLGLESFNPHKLEKFVLYEPLPFCWHAGIEASMKKSETRVIYVGTLLSIQRWLSQNFCQHIYLRKSHTLHGLHSCVIWKEKVHCRHLFSMDIWKLFSIGLANLEIIYIYVYKNSVTISEYFSSRH